MITVIHHSADFDGIFCREIARKFLPDAKLIGWDYSDPGLEFPKEGTVYVLDLSPDCFWENPLRAEFIERLIWIDHHKSAIEKYAGTNINGYRIDGVSACRLAWQWFAECGSDAFARSILPGKSEFTERKVAEPWSVRLAGEYDIWDKRDPDAELFQHGLRSEELYPTTWDSLLSEDGATVVRLLNQGRALQYAKTKENESIINSLGFTIQFEGLNFLACNHARYNSFLFTAGLQPEHDACFGFKYSKGKWEVSLYHAPGKEHHDLSEIAKKYGGGGHRGACGFRVDKLPFIN